MADPTIVLVHGAFADTSSWSRLYAELAGSGLTIPAWAVVGTGDHAIPPAELLAWPGKRTPASPSSPAPRTFP